VNRLILKRLRAKDTGAAIVGTLETVRGCALIDGIDGDGYPVYAGQTDIWWDEQRTVYTADDKPIYIDEFGNEVIDVEEVPE
jgi:hypothetical protein